MRKIIFVLLVYICNPKIFAISASSNPLTIKASGYMIVAFSPNGGVSKSVVTEINHAKNSILIEAYSFTSKEIAKALVDAKKRNISIKIILDKSQVKQKYSSAQFFYNQGFLLHIDTKHAIFHNKVMIIDANTVITGSYNFTNAAETKNAENLLIIKDNIQLAKIYTQEFFYNWQQSLNYVDYINHNIIR